MPDLSASFNGCCIALKSSCCLCVTASFCLLLGGKMKMVWAELCVRDTLQKTRRVKGGRKLHCRSADLHNAIICSCFYTVYVVIMMRSCLMFCSGAQSGPSGTKFLRILGHGFLLCKNWLIWPRQITSDQVFSSSSASSYKCLSRLSAQILLI